MDSPVHVHDRDSLSRTALYYGDVAHLVQRIPKLDELSFRDEAEVFATFLIVVLPEMPEQFELEFGDTSSLLALAGVFGQVAVSHVISPRPFRLLKAFAFLRRKRRA
jgi:hypothetical protein